MQLQIKEAIAASRGDFGAAEAACALLGFEEKSATNPALFSSSQRREQRDGQNNDHLFLWALQKRVHDSGELLKSFAQPEPVTANSAFANYVRDGLISMNKRNFRKAMLRINDILTELKYEESDG